VSAEHSVHPAALSRQAGERAVQRAARKVARGRTWGGRRGRREGACGGAKQCRCGRRQVPGPVKWKWGKMEIEWNCCRSAQEENVPYSAACRHTAMSPPYKGSGKEQVVTELPPEESACVGWGWGCGGA